MLGLALDSVWSLLWAPTLTKDGQILQACVSALYYALILNRSSEFSIPGCYYCPNVLTIIVCRNLGHQKVFLLNLEMNVMKFITRNKIIPSVWDARQILRAERRSGWDYSLLEMDMAVVYRLEISENWTAVRWIFFIFLSMPCYFSSIFHFLITISSNRGVFSYSFAVLPTWF